MEYNAESTISLCLYDDEMKMLVTYLRLIIDEIKKEEVQELVDKGIIVEDDGKAWRDKWDS